MGKSGHKAGSVDRWPIQRAQEGATLMEMAIILPVIILIVVGTMEIGMAFKDYLTIGALSREGARVAALAARADDADCAVLKGIASLAGQADLDRITSVQIFKAAEGTGTQGATNTWSYTGGDANECHVPSEVGDGWSPGGIAYPPGTRNTTIYDAGTPTLDLIGVRIQLTRSWITGFPPFRGSFQIDESTISRVEPEAFD